MDMTSTALSDLLNGSTHGWTRFVEEAAPVIWAQVRRCFNRYSAGSDPVDLEDVSQDVFLRLSRGDFSLLRRFDPTRAKLSTYLGVVAHSASVDFLRKRRQAHEDIADYGDQLAAPEAKAEADTGGVLGLMPDALLSDRQRLILTKLYDEDKDVEEIAEELGVAAQTIRSAKHKALTKIRTHVHDNPHLLEAA